MLSGRLLSYLKKRKLSRNGHSLTLVVIVVPLIVTHCHSLSLILTGCTTRCHSFSLDVLLVCLFINNPNFALSFCRSSCPEVFCFLEIFLKFTGKFAKIVNFAKFLRTPFLTEHLPWLVQFFHSNVWKKDDFFLNCI